MEIHLSVEFCAHFVVNLCWIADFARGAKNSSRLCAPNVVLALFNVTEPQFHVDRVNTRFYLKTILKTERNYYSIDKFICKQLFNSFP